MLVWKGDKLLLIERKNPPFGFAPPAGHLDDDDFETAVRRELKEETGLDTKNIRLLAEGRKENYCRREKGDWHYWKIYEVESSGEVKRSKEETKQLDFYAKEAILSFAVKTEKYLSGETKTEDWRKSPGLEPVWYDWFKELKII